MKFWDIIEKAVNDLVENDDLEEKTSREHIVGYIVQSIINKYPHIK